MKLRLMQAGFENYTGQMGVIDFVDGLSTGDVLPVFALRLAGIFGAEWEDGSPANVSQIYLDSMNNEAPLAAATYVPTIEAPLEVPVEPAAIVIPSRLYTEEELAGIADAKGIAGLREIADPLGVKGNAIRGLIDGILKAAGAPKAK